MVPKNVMRPMSVSDIWNRLSSNEDEKCAIYYDTPLACTDNIIKIDDISINVPCSRSLHLFGQSIQGRKLDKTK